MHGGLTADWFWWIKSVVFHKPLIWLNKALHKHHVGSFQNVKQDGYWDNWDNYWQRWGRPWHRPVTGLIGLGIIQFCWFQNGIGDDWNIDIRGLEQKSWSHCIYFVEEQNKLNYFWNKWLSARRNCRSEMFHAGPLGRPLCSPVISLLPWCCELTMDGGLHVDNNTGNVSHFDIISNFSTKISTNFDQFCSDSRLWNLVVQVLLNSCQNNVVDNL